MRKTSAESPARRNEVKTNRKPIRLCFVGNMLGRNPGYVTSQGQIVADLFAAEDYEVSSVSPKINRAARLFDIARFLLTNRRRIDIIVLEIYSGWYMFLADAASRIAGRLKIPLIGVLHGGNLPDFAGRHPRWIRRVLSRTNAIVAPSPYLADAMRIYGFDVRVIPNVIDIKAYSFRLRKQVEPRLFWMRSFHPAYNPQLAMEVLAHLRRTHPQASLVMAGRDKGLEGEIRELARENGVRNAVRFPGFLDEESKMREFSQADIFVNTNKIDNMPIAVVEACAMGLPVVATDVGGISSLLQNDVTGLLVADDDAEAMVEAIKRLLGDANLTEQISRNGRELAERSSWNSVKKLWEDLFAEVLNRK